MAGLKELRNRLESARSTQQLTSAMKMVSVSKLRKAQVRSANVRAICFRLMEIYRNVSLTIENIGSENLLTGGYPRIERVLVIVLASDKGMCGNFNTNVCKEAERHIKRRYKDIAVENISVLPVGNRAVAYFAGKDYKKSDIKAFSPTEAVYEDVAAFVRRVEEAYTRGDFHRVDMICEKSINAATQIVRARKIFPIDSILKAGNRLLSEERKQTASAAALKDAHSAASFGAFFSEDVEILPDPKTFILAMMPQVPILYFYLTLCQSLVAEHGARMTAMSKASDNADVLIKELNLKYNKLRQSAITNELLEIVSGANALSAGE